MPADFPFVANFKGSKPRWANTEFVMTDQRHISDLACLFRSPPREFAPAPFWCWNGDGREEELLSQLGELKAKGCGGFFLHPRHGLRVPYLSERWFELVRRVVDEAARLGLAVWLYDEENWPSGTVGGHLTRERPDLRHRYLKFYELSGDAEFKVPDPENLVHAVALPVPSLGEHWNLARAVRLTSDLSTRNLPPATRVFVFTECDGGYVDPMNPAVAQQFLAMTHEAYAAACGERFGSGVVGIFTDEPTLVSVWEVGEERWLPWSPLLPDEFQREHGYDLIPFLPSLLLDTGVSASKVRQNFWQTVRRLYASNFFQPIAAWCAEHRLFLTGHLLHEEPLFRQVRFQGDALNVYRQMHVPGVDHAGVKWGGLHHKLCASVAHQNGKGRVLSHTFGGCGWGVSLAQRKTALDWQLAMGVNLVAPHAAYYSIHGKRKRESPPSEFHEPHWRHYQHFADYVARLCWALTQGRHVAKVCVLYPLRSAWAHHHPLRRDVLFDAVEEDLFYVCDLLTRLHYDYDFMDEETLQTAEIREGQLVVEDEAYEMLVLPSVTTLSRAAWQKIKTFYQSSGKVAALGLLPRESEQGADEELEKDVTATALVDLEYVYQCYQQAAEEDVTIDSYPIFREDVSGGRFCSYQPRLCLDQDDAKLRVRQILRESVTPDVDTGNEAMVYHHRRIGALGMDFYFFVNTSGEAQRVNVRLHAAGAPEWWNAETGDVTPLHVYTLLDEDADERTMVLPLQFAPHESKLIAIRPDERWHVDTTNVDIERIHPPSRDHEGAVVIEGYVEEETTPFAEMSWQDEPLWLQGERTPSLPPLDLSEGWTMETEDDNVWVLPDWEFQRGRHAPVGLSRLLRWREAWETVPPRERITPRPRLEPLERELPPMVTYRTRFDVNQIPPQLFLVMEAIDAPCEVYVNGKPLMMERGGMERWKGKGLPYADAQSLCADVSHLTRVGENTITLIADYSRTTVTPPDHRHRITCDLVPERARLVGSFRMTDNGRMDVWAYGCMDEFAASTHPHVRTAQGYPHYSGTMIYRRAFSLPPKYAGKKLTLEVEQAADVLKLEVNGRAAGVRLWAPFRFEVTHLLREGENALALCVTNTAANALLGSEQPSGILGAVHLRAHHPIVLKKGE
jgi:hypothetical protein